MRAPRTRFAGSVSLIALLFAMVSSDAMAKDSVALQVFREWLHAYNSGNEAGISAFWQKYGGDRQPGDRVALDIRLHSVTGNMILVRITEESPNHLVALMRENRGTFSESSVDLVSVSPPVIARIVGHPLPSLENLPPRATNDADIATKVRQLVAAAKGTDAFSGVILIAHHGSLVLDEAWGFADMGKRVPNSAGTQFNLASMNKMFTAISILQLADRGRLNLDDSLGKYLPDYPNRELAATVTIRELLSHTGGTGDYLTPDFTTHKAEIRTLSDYVNMFGARPVRFKPGTRFEYSNYGFILLGRIVEVASGQTYDQYFRDHILNPAGMRHTTPVPESGQVAAIAYSQTRDGIEPTDSAFHLPASSAGGWYSDAHDLYLFTRALQSGLLLSPRRLAQALTWDSIHPAYGLGFFLLPGLGYGHSGASPGCNTELHILPESHYVVVILTNRDPPMATDMFDAVHAILPLDPTSTTRK
jgi:D-alanyl-D-alanine carboxypeptidase